MNNEFLNKVKADLIPFNITVFNPEDIEFFYFNDSDDISVDYKYMSTGLHYNRKEIDELDVIGAGFKWFGTWNYYE